MIEPDELAAWLRLLETPGVGRETARRLLAAFGSPQAVLAAGTAARRDVVGAAPAAALAAPDPGFEALVDATSAWLNAESATARRVVPLGDPLYPQALLDAADPPLLLYAQGRAELLGAASIAIVGSRHATPQGLANARAFAAELGASGLTVVSGLALGIDAAAHEGALEAPAGTVAVVGTGLDRVYPSRHKALAHRIAERGLMVSEYALGTPPLPARFPVRNRIIAALSRGTLVVEAALQSGSLITARLASENGREVFAIPGSIHSPQSRGCHALIKQGAKLVETVQDVLEELRWPAPAVAGAGASTDASIGAEGGATAGATDLAAGGASSDARGDTPADPLLDALGFDPVTLDALVARTGWPAADLHVRLLDMELDGRVARLPGQLFQRIARA